MATHYVTALTGLLGVLLCWSIKGSHASSMFRKQLANVMNGEVRQTTTESTRPAVLRSGPYGIETTDAQLTISGSTAPGCGNDGCLLKLVLSSPARNADLGPGSVPTILMFNGFQMPSVYYRPYAHALASWGFAVLQYDLPGWGLKKIIRDDEEVKFIPLLLDWLHQQSRDPATAIYEILDTQRVGAFGHSRGAKLAALALAGTVGGIRAAVLIDPIDMSTITRKRHYPSAVEALAHSPQQALLIGAGVHGVCNPIDEGWTKFWGVLQEGSWLQQILPAGHAAFLDIKALPAWALDKLCGNNVSHKVAMHLSEGPAIAWLLSKLKPSQQADKLVAEYLAWVKAESGKGLLEFTIKEQPPQEHRQVEQLVKQHAQDEMAADKPISVTASAR